MDVNQYFQIAFVQYKLEGNEMFYFTAHGITEAPANILNSARTIANLPFSTSSPGFNPDYLQFV